MSKPEDALRKKFLLLDTNDDGHISWPEFEEFVRGLGVDPVTARSRFWRMDRNRDDRISFAEFLDAMSHLAPTD